MILLGCPIFPCSLSAFLEVCGWTDIFREPIRSRCFILSCFVWVFWGVLLLTWGLFCCFLDSWEGVDSWLEAHSPLVHEWLQLPRLNCSGISTLQQPDRHWLTQCASCCLVESYYHFISLTKLSGCLTLGFKFCSRSHTRPPSGFRNTWVAHIPRDGSYPIQSEQPMV